MPYLTVQLSEPVHRLLRRLRSEQRRSNAAIISDALETLAAGYALLDVPTPVPTPERQPEPSTMTAKPELLDPGLEPTFTDVELSFDESAVVTDIVAIEPALEHAETLPAFRELAPAAPAPEQLEDELEGLLGQF
jgi:hypothetical protein